MKPGHIPLFIAELLNPQGSHGLGDAFLKAFISQVNLNDFDFDTSSAKVQVEYHIGFKNEEKTEGGRVDILITSKGKAILIENKIYTGDQENQLIRYFNYGKEKYGENFWLLYLTLYGNEASELSANSADKKLDELKKWIESKGWSFGSEGNVLDGANYQGIAIYKEEYHPWALWFCQETAGPGVFYGISNFGGELIEIKQQQYPKFEGETSKGWPFGFQWFNPYRHWNDVSTLRDMANGKVLKTMQEIIEPIMQDIESGVIPLK